MTTIEVSENMKKVIRDALIRELGKMQKHVSFNKKTNKPSSLVVDDPRAKEYLKVLKSLGFSGVDSDFGLKYRASRNHNSL